MNVTGGHVSPSASFAGAESPGTTVTLDAGSFSVNESSDLGYDKSLSTDCSGTIANGQTKTCTITNDDKPNTVAITTQQKVILHDRATITGILRNANETTATVTFRLYNSNTCGAAAEVGNEQVNAVPTGSLTSVQVGTVTGVTITLDTNPGNSTTQRWWKAFYSGNNVGSGGPVLNSPQESLCTETTTVTMAQ
jgi:hypothetical protein